MPPDDPLGRHGPTLNNFLSKKPVLPEPKWQPCPYGGFLPVLELPPLFLLALASQQCFTSAEGKCHCHVLSRFVWQGLGSGLHKCVMLFPLLLEWLQPQQRLWLC